jgi:hypothetical protein
MNQAFKKYWTPGNEGQGCVREEANEVNPTIAPVYFPERVSNYGTGGGNPENPGNFLELRKWNCESGWVKMMELK